MKEIILLKDGEVALKGLNRYTFEDTMIKNAKRRLSPLGHFRYYKAQSTIYIEPMVEGLDMDEAVERLKKVFGIAAICRACIAEKDWADICRLAPDYLAPQLEEARTFKVKAKRSDKKFPLASPEICAEMGGILLDRFPHLKVDVKNPDVTVTIEIRDYAAYIHADQIPGPGGMPVGSSGRAALLLSGGIDSPVAGYMMAKRGLELSAIHFVSPPYTSDRAKLKVIELAHIMTAYTGRIDLHVVNLTQIQELIKEHCPEDLFTVVMRRFMMKIAERIAEQWQCSALITGESLAQVASQTVQAIACTDAATVMPVLRPVIGMDKEEIVRISRKIDTFETSIQPYEDCCTVFTPKHPKTKPTLQMLLDAEALIPNAEELINTAVETAEFIMVSQEGAKGYIE